MKKVYVNYDNDFYVNQYSYNDTELEEAFMEDDFDIKFGYTKVKEEDGKLILYNDIQCKSQYYVDGHAHVSSRRYPCEGGQNCHGSVFGDKSSHAG